MKLSWKPTCTFPSFTLPLPLITILQPLTWVKISVNLFRINCLIHCICKLPPFPWLSAYCLLAR